jgi:hypothetical protein
MTDYNAVFMSLCSIPFLLFNNPSYFMTLGMNIMPLETTLAPYFLISYNQ